MSCNIRYRETAGTYKCEIIKIIKKSLLLEDIYLYFSLLLEDINLEITRYIRNVILCDFIIK